MLSSLWRTGRRLTSSLLTTGQMLAPSQIQEHRLEVWLDWRQLRDVQALISQQPVDHSKVQLVADQADLENPVGERLNDEAGCAEENWSPQVVRYAHARRQGYGRG